MALASFTVLRALLLIRSWKEAAHGLPDMVYVFLGGIGYDLSFLAYASIGFALIFLILPGRVFNSRIARWSSHALFFLMTNALLFVLAAEWFFWEEFGVRFNFISVDYLIYRQEVTDNICQSYPVAWIFTGIAAGSLGLWLIARASISRAMNSREPLDRRLRFTSLILALAIVSYFLADPCMKDRSDNNYTNELACNGPYQFVSAFRQNRLEYRQFYAMAQDGKVSDMLKQTVHKPASRDGLFDLSRTVAPDRRNNSKPNVIVLCVESLSASFLTRFGNTENSITPFLDTWFSQGLLFTRCYATGTRTARGLEAVSLSIPPTPGRSLVKRPDNARMYTLGKAFQDNGYDTAFIYGGRGYFDNMNAFFSGNGYRVVDKTDFSDDDIQFENAWGVCDEDLFSQVIRQAGKDQAKGQPFFFHVMTTSNHRPYTYPEGKIDIPPGSSRNGAVKYTDYAIQTFMKKARREPWFDSTLFVLVADHCASSAGKVGIPIDRYHIPLFIYGPSLVSPGEVDAVCSQVDIAPTLLGLAGLEYASWFFGEDLMSPSFQPRALVGNYQKLALYKDDVLTILSPNQEIQQYLDPLGSPSSVNGPALTDSHVISTIMYYQGADYIVAHGLNRWN